MAYGLANILAAIPITPGGLGVVEFVLVTMITGFGPTAGQALSAVLAYRAVNFWLPIPFGGLAYASLEFERRTPYRRFRQFVHRRRDLRLAAGAGSPGADTKRAGCHPPGIGRPRPSPRDPVGPGPAGAGGARSGRPERDRVAATVRRARRFAPGRIAPMAEGFEGLCLEVILQVEAGARRRVGMAHAVPRAV